MKEVRTHSSDKSLVTKRRRHIMQCALRLFVEKGGYFHTSTREIAEACGMSAGTLYHYVGSKEDILYLIINDAVSRQAKFIKKLSDEFNNVNPTDALRESIKLFFQQADGDQDLYIFVNREIGNLARNDRKTMLDAEERTMAFFEKLLTRGVESGELKVNDPRLVAQSIILFAHSWATWRWFLRKYYTLEDYTRQRTEYILGVNH